MRKIFGIGETICDIIFKDNQPFRAVPGGSTFNCLISLGRLNLPVSFISEIGKDKIGSFIKSFMEENNLSTEYIDFFEDGNSPVALAFLDNEKKVEYTFYRNFPESRLNIDFPTTQKEDLLVLSSYYAVNPVLRERFFGFLQQAAERGTIIYYDINFRKAHAHERIKLMSLFLENFELSDIIRCSDEDLETLYPGKSIESIYRDHISFYCRNVIVTQGPQNVLLKTGRFDKQYEIKPLHPVSAIGAGDSFNAGLIYGIMKYNYTKEQLNRLEEKEWDGLIALAIQFASEVCMSLDNYITPAFASSLL